MIDWHEISVGDLFSNTIPGEWGTEPIVKPIPVLRSTNIQKDGEIEVANVVMRSVPDTKLENRKAMKGDILVEKSGGGPGQPAGRVALIRDEFRGTCSNFLELCKINPNVDQVFALYILLDLYQAGRIYKYQQQTTGIINFKFDQYKRERIKVPKDSAVQISIARAIDSVRNEILILKQLIAKQERVRAGLLQTLLTRGIDDNGEIRSGPTKNELSQANLVPRCWSYITLGSLLKKTGGHIQTGPFGTQLKASEYSNTGLPLFNPQDISPRGLLIYDHAARVSIERAAPLMRHRVRPGDVLFGRRGDLSRAAVVREDDDGLCGSDCLLMRYSNEKMLPDWFWLIFKSPICQRPLARSAVGTTMVGLNTALIEELNFWMPTVAEQHRIVEAVQMQDRVIELQLQRLEKLKMLKTGLMRDLLSGRMSVEPLLPDLPPKP
jgi:type I restriction enzyme, S subunit